MGTCESSNSSLRLKNEKQEFKKNSSKNFSSSTLPTLDLSYLNKEDSHPKISSKMCSSSTLPSLDLSCLNAEDSHPKISSKMCSSSTLSSLSSSIFNSEDFNEGKRNSSNESFNKSNILDNSLYLLPETIAKREDICKNYKLSKKVLGEGATSLVYKAENSSKKKFAVKRIKKNNIGRRKEMIISEAEICLQLKHNNIIKYYEIYEDINFISIVMELGENDLYDLILSHPSGVVSDHLVIDFLIQIFEVIDYLHNVKNIVHCDIKEENFIVKFDKKTKRTILKLIDFGNIRQKPIDNERLHNYCGTKECMPPEALGKYGFNEKADEWAAGLIMYNMLTGCDPFASNNDFNYKKNIKSKEINFEYIKNKKLRELNKKLLNRSLDERISAKEALEEIKKIKDKNSVISLKESKTSGITIANNAYLKNMA